MYDKIIVACSTYTNMNLIYFPLIEIYDFSVSVLTPQTCCQMYVYSGSLHHFKMYKGTVIQQLLPIRLF
jgi:hypothetical protein